jgi:putative endonuclease
MASASPKDLYSKTETGRRVEARALVFFLETRPESRLIARNWRCRSGELDLVFEEAPGPGRAPELAFVEVRFRDAQSAWQTPLESVGGPKLIRLRRAMGVFLARYRGPARSVRLDVLEWDGKGWAHRQAVI